MVVCGIGFVRGAANATVVPIVSLIASAGSLACYAAAKDAAEEHPNEDADQPNRTRSTHVCVTPLVETREQSPHDRWDHKATDGAIETASKGGEGQQIGPGI
jgi:hypothetical protein